MLADMLQCNRELRASLSLSHFFLENYIPPLVATKMEDCKTDRLFTKGWLWLSRSRASAMHLGCIAEAQQVLRLYPSRLSFHKAFSCFPPRLLSRAAVTLVRTSHSSWGDKLDEVVLLHCELASYSRNLLPSTSAIFKCFTRRSGQPITRNTTHASAHVTPASHKDQKCPWHLSWKAAKVQRTIERF